MGVDEGWDMVPQLTSCPEHREKWDSFLAEIKLRFHDDSNVQIKPHWIEFTVGEHPRLPFQGYKFLRFSSKISGSCGDAEPYIQAVTTVARSHFGSRVNFWSEACGQEGYYGWNKVRRSFERYSQPDVVAPFNFLGLPSEVRNQIYELLLVEEEPIDFWIERFQFYSGGVTAGLLRANKFVHSEASSLLYGQNRFSFATTHLQKIVAFFDQIGDNNMGHIRHVIIDFPGLTILESQGVALEDHSASVLANLQSRCVNLSTLTTSLHSADILLGLDPRDTTNQEITSEALRLVDARFRAIPSLHDIIVEVYDSERDRIIQEIKALGLTIRTHEPIEDRGSNACGWRANSDYEDDDDGDDYDINNDAWGWHSHSDDDYGDDGNDYDIDNDSDFWRRAQD